MKEKELLKLKNEIEQAKRRLSELKGEEKYLMKELKDKWQCSSLEEAQEKIEGLKAEADKLDEQIEMATQEIRSRYNV